MRLLLVHKAKCSIQQGCLPTTLVRCKPASQQRSQWESAGECCLQQNETQGYYRIFEYIDAAVCLAGSIEEWLIQPAPAAANAAMAVAIAALSWPDDSSAVKAASICRYESR